MQPLSGLDASFLYLEQPHMPMHVGSVLVVEGSMAFEDFRDLLATRIHLVPRMRQRLVTVPLDLGKPYWADDPAFDLDLHLHHVALPRPGGWRQLRRLAARVFSTPLDRSRALWEFWVIDGLDTLPQVPPGSVGLLGKVHHAAIDGVSGADMMGILFDVTEAPPPADPPPPWSPAPLPNELTVLRKAARSLIRKPRQLPRLLRDGLKALRAGNEVVQDGVELPPAPFTAPPTPLNHVVSPQRVWNTALLELDRVKALKDAMGCTVNDVVLAICAGALRRYLAEKGQLPAQPLVSMVPVSTRRSDAHGTLGNQISAMLVQLATHVEDPVERLRITAERAKSGKAYQGAVGASTLADLAEVVPFRLAGQAARVYSRFRVAERHTPLFNVVITNVPGPQVGLYVARHKLLTSMGMAPIIDGMGLIITVLSYHGVLSLSPTSCSSLMPDVDDFARMLREEANALEAAVLATVPAEPEATEEERRSLDDIARTFFAGLAERLARSERQAEGRLQFHVTGAAPSSWLVDLATRSVDEARAPSADATLTMKDEHLALLAEGRLDPQMAFVQGKLRVEGDVGKAIRLGPYMPRPQPAAG